MNDHCGPGLVWCAVALALGGCAASDAKPAKPDGGAAAPKAAKKEKEKKGGVVADVLSDGDGGPFFRSYPECMATDEATRRAKAPPDQFGRTESENSIGLLGAAEKTDKPRKGELSECPEYIWTYVGRGHGFEPVGNVQAPLGTAATRKERKTTPKACCYLIPPEPGSPNG